MALRTTIAIVLAVAVAYLLSIAASAWHAASQPPRIYVWAAREDIAVGSPIRREHFYPIGLLPSDPRLKSPLIRRGSAEEREIFHGPLPFYSQSHHGKNELLDVRRVATASASTLPRPGFVAYTIAFSGGGCSVKYGPFTGDHVGVVKTIVAQGRQPGDIDRFAFTNDDVVVETVITSAKVLGTFRASPTIDHITLELRPDQAEAMQTVVLNGELGLILGGLE